MTDDSTTDDDQNASSTSTTAQVTHRRSADTRPTVDVVRAVAAFTDTTVLDLEPLGDVIDTEALNDLFAERDAETNAAEMTFEYERCTVTVTPDAVEVTRLEE
ncbi:HalOD1 output domain-containing protein [Halosimplex salinum]|uniref:HalOD1 output domain-containing protein n=1 Tax=Halosimplex salinum TaxID=1710538 RepID=UPI0013DE1ADC|nr:HalOD1 output domain-containing protein [Halosimplex salinum]